MNSVSTSRPVTEGEERRQTLPADPRERAIVFCREHGGRVSEVEELLLAYRQDVIEWAARQCEAEKTGGHWQNDNVRDNCAVVIRRGLASPA